MKIGVPWPPFKFFERAKQLAHPFSAFCAPDEVIRAVFLCLTLGPAAVEEKRNAFFEKWEREALRLESAENVLCEFLHEDVKPFAKQKRPLLTKAIMEEAGFKGADLVDQFTREGWPMFGNFPRTSVFPSRSHEAAVGKDELLKTAKWARPALLNSAAFSLSEKTHMALFQATCDELEAGECRGPFTPEELDRKYPGGWLY